MRTIVSDLVFLGGYIGIHFLLVFCGAFDVDFRGWFFLSDVSEIIFELFFVVEEMVV